MKDFLESFFIFFIILLGIVITLAIIIGLAWLITIYTTGILQAILVILLVITALSFIFASLQVILS